MQTRQPYTVGSLFSGIGGIDLAFQTAGFDIVFQVEIDDFCNRVLARHWPHVPHYGDIRTVSAADLPRCDVLVGGFPCQDISAAGKGAGIRAGTRSGLWFEFARLIGDLRPRVVLLENVSAITARDGTIVLGNLAEMGYDAQWGTLRASDAGAPHQRERWFCMAYRTGANGQLESAKRGQATQNGWASEAVGGRSGPVLADSTTARLSEWGYSGEPTGAAETGGWVESEPERPGIVGNAISAGLAGRQSQRRNNGAQQPPLERTGHELAHPHRTNRQTRRTYRMGDERKRAEQRGTASYPGKGPTQPRVGRDVARLPYRLDAPRWPAPPGHAQYADEPPRTTQEKTYRTQRLKALGNAVVPQVVYPLALAIAAWLKAQDAAMIAEAAR